MPETYLLELQNGRLVFSKSDAALPQCVLTAHFSPDDEKGDVSIVCRMGDPDLIHCAVYRRSGQPGGIFSMHDRDGLLFAAHAPSNLVYAAACGFFGEMVANARYGVDVFEEMEEPDD